MVVSAKHCFQYVARTRDDDTVGVTGEEDDLKREEWLRR